ncbi:MAG: YqgE/AlgH family protein, partial [Pseudomonadota bacterium]
MAEDSVNLTGKLLVAMPGMGDPRFSQSVVYICAHDQDGSMGLIVNKPQRDVEFAHLLKELEIEQGPKARDIRVHFGG